MIGFIEKIFITWGLTPNELRRLLKVARDYEKAQKFLQFVEQTKKVEQAKNFLKS